MLQLKFNNENGQAPLETDSLPLSIEQPDVLRTGLTAGVARTLNAEPTYKEKRTEMLRNVAGQYGIGAAIRRQADLKIVEQFHR